MNIGCFLVVDYRIQKRGICLKICSGVFVCSVQSVDTSVGGWFLCSWWLIGDDRWGCPVESFQSVLRASSSAVAVLSWRTAFSWVISDLYFSSRNLIYWLESILKFLCFLFVELAEYRHRGAEPLPCSDRRLLGVLCVGTLSFAHDNGEPYQITYVICFSCGEEIWTLFFCLQVLNETFPKHMFLMNGIIVGIKVSNVTGIWWFWE